MHERAPMKVSSFDAASPFPVSAAPGRNVLVVESDPDQRRRVVTQLSHRGYPPFAPGCFVKELAPTAPGPSRGDRVISP